MTDEPPRLGSLPGLTSAGLTSAGVALAEAAGLRVDVDAYGCAYCVEATQDDRFGLSVEVQL